MSVVKAISVACSAIEENLPVQDQAKELPESVLLYKSYFLQKSSFEAAECAVLDQ